MDDAKKVKTNDRESGSAGGAEEKKPQPRPTADPPRGMASSVNRKAVLGPDGPTGMPGPRERLCKLLNLKAPTDTQLFADAAARIEELEAELAKPK